MLLYGKKAVLVAVMSLMVGAFCLTQVSAEEQQAVQGVLIKTEQSHTGAVEKTTLVEAGNEGDANVELTPQQIDEIGMETATIGEAAGSVDVMIDESAVMTGDAATVDVTAVEPVNEAVETAASTKAIMAPDDMVESTMTPMESASDAVTDEAVVPEAQTAPVITTVESSSDAVDVVVSVEAVETATIAPVESISAEVMTSVDVVKQDNAFLTFEADRRHACAIKTDNTLWCWGANNFGQLGNGTMEDSVIPTQVGQEAGWRFIKRGENHTCAIKINATLWCWGANQEGQLGDGTSKPSRTPINVGGTDWVAVDGNGNATCGTKKSGALSCWGAGVELSKTEKSAADGSENCGVNDDGSVWCWQTSHQM